MLVNDEGVAILSLLKIQSGFKGNLRDSSGDEIRRGEASADHSDQVYLLGGQKLEVYVYTDTGSNEATEGGSENNFVAIHKLS